MRVLILCLLVVCAFSLTPSMDIWEEIDDINCTLKSYTNMVFRVYQSVGKVEPNFAKNAKYVKDSKAVVSLSAYIVPCITCNITKQVEEIAAAIKDVKLVMLWIVVQGAWSHDRNVNVQFLQSFVDEVKKLGEVGIQTDIMSWMRNMGRDHSNFSSLKLWYVLHDKRPDGGFMPFGGWRHAYAKQYETAELCGDTINHDSIL